MKACKFCETLVEDQEQRCPSCGGNVFLHVCENCGNHFDSGFCPNCGVQAGQKKKVCPECHSAYFTNACPNCGYTPGRKPVVQEVVHRHVYVKPEPIPQPRPTPTEARQEKQRKVGCGCLSASLIFVLIVFITLTCIHSATKKTTSTGTYRKQTFSIATTDPNATPIPTEVPEPAVAAAQEKADQYFATAGEEEIAAVRKADDAYYQYEAKLYDKVLVVRHCWEEDRGTLGISQDEPDYVGALGYAAVYSDQKMNTKADFGTTPWKVPVYEKDKQFWQETGTIDHKTEVVVIGQELEMPERKYKTARCKGYLHVIRMDTGETCWLNVGNFVTEAYWENSLTEAMEKGYCIATFRQESDYYPVTRNNRKVEMEDGMQVLLPMKGSFHSSSPDKENNPVIGIVFKQWENAFGGVDVFFNEKDLTLSY